MNFQLILDFLSELREHNNRDWFEANRSRYLEAKTIFEEIVQEFIHEISSFDSRLGGVEAKKCTFRIFRDVRFSKDKSPYKINFGASMADGGRKSVNPSYYIHLQPGGDCFLGGGLYHPEPDNLKKVRQEIDYNAKDFLGIVEDKAFRKQFGEMWGERLKRPPKGYEADNPVIEYLKMKDFVVLHRLTDDEVIKPGFLKKGAGVYKKLKPLNDFLVAAMD